MVQAKLVGEAHGAVGLHGAVDRLEADLHRIGLGHGELLHRRRALVEQGGDVEAHQVRGMQLHGAFGQREGDALVLGDRLAERLALLGVVERLLERPAAVADGTRRIVDPPQRHAVQRGREALVQLADELPRLDPHVLEPQLGLVAADMAEQLDDALDLEARRRGRHQEGRDAALARRRALGIGDGEDDAVVRDRRVRRPDLAPGQPPGIAVGHRLGRERRSVGARAGLAEAEAHRGLARHHRRQDLLARLVGDLLEQPARPEGPMADHVEHQPVLRPAEMEQRLPADVVGKMRQPAAAQRFGHAHIVVAGLGRRRAAPRR